MRRLRAAMSMGGKCARYNWESGGMAQLSMPLHCMVTRESKILVRKGRAIAEVVQTLREFVRDILGPVLLQGLIIAVQVIAKNMEAPKARGEKKAKRVLRTDLVRVCCQLLADATFKCKSNAHHLLQLHIVRVIHGVLCNFPHNPAIVKAASCIAINICHDDTDAQHMIAQGLLTKVVELLDEIMPHVLPLRGGANVGGGTSEHNQHLETEALHDEAKQDGAPRHHQANTEKQQRQSTKMDTSSIYGVDMFRSTKDRLFSMDDVIVFCFS